MVGASVRVKGLTKRYGDVVAVDGVSLSVERGAFVTLLGPSGSGKTTTLMMLAGFVVPTAGEIHIDDRLVTLDPPYKRDLGMVFQNYALFPHMTAFDNVAFPLRMRKVPRGEIAERVERALELVRLPGLGHRFPKQLSGGQQQRVALARTLVFNPRVLLMDEPLGALDKKLRQQMQLEIKHLHEQLGITVIYVTHDQEEALVMSDQIVVMRNGCVEQVGTPRAVYDEPRNDFVADFIGETNVLDGTIIKAEHSRYRVRTSAHVEVWCAGEGGLDPGRPVTMIIRPERARFVQSAESDNCLPARVEEVVFVGELIRYLLRLSSGEAIVLKCANNSQVPDYAVGARVLVRIDPEDIRVLPPLHSQPKEDT